MVTYLDTGDIGLMQVYGPQVQGFTTNPTLMRKAGIGVYRDFAKAVLQAVGDKPVSFEVMSDEFDEMQSQAREIASWGNTWVKIPITNTKGESSAPLIRKLSLDGLKLNVTAITTLDQIELAARSLIYAPGILSVFCGRIADTGRDPVPFITKALNVKSSNTKVLWASTREAFNVKQAEACGCDIITLSPELLKKTKLFGKNLHEYSLETVKQFHQDAQACEF